MVEIKKKVVQQGARWTVVFSEAILISGVLLTLKELGDTHPSFSIGLILIGIASSLGLIRFANVAPWIKPYHETMSKAGATIGFPLINFDFVYGPLALSNPSWIVIFVGVLFAASWFSQQIQKQELYNTMIALTALISIGAYGGELGIVGAAAVVIGFALLTTKVKVPFVEPDDFFHYFLVLGLWLFGQAAQDKSFSFF